MNPLMFAMTVFAATHANDNLALGKHYTLEPHPNYVCSSPEDSQKLTDGNTTSDQGSSTGYFWTKKTTVGWHYIQPVIITVDLGKIEPIGGATYKTAAGASSVEWPMAITVLTSEDGNIFHVAGDLTPTTPLPSGYGVRRYHADQFQTRGRYVAFLVSPSGPFTFVDEIEVSKGNPQWLDHPLAGEPVRDLRAFFRAGAIQRGVERRLRADAQAFGIQLPSISRVDDQNFRAVLPLNALHERIFAAQAKQWHAQGLPPITIWQSGLWDSLSYTQTPPRTAQVAINVAMMQNEFRAAAFNISNAGNVPVSEKVRIVGLPDCILLHEVAWTDTANGTPVAAALPEVKDAVINVPAGLTRQVWLTFHPTDVPPGIYNGKILIGDAAVPIALHIYPIRFPDQPALHVGGWDYTDADVHGEITQQNRAVLIKHLREHFVDSPWATLAVVDLARFDEWLTRWPNARQYCIFAGRDVSGQIAVLVHHAQTRGIRPEQLAILLVDEPHTSAQDATIIDWAKAIQAAKLGVKIWEDPTHSDPTTANQEMMSACNVLCPNRPMFLMSKPAFRDYYAKRRAAGTELAFYSCLGPVRLLDPYTYHRLQAWSCWQQGALSSYFWAFGDTGGASSWNEYASPHRDYTPVFLDATSVTAGKHMEALREGVEDYEYLRMLSTAIGKAQHSQALTHAKRLLASAANRVLNATGASDLMWAQVKDRTIADSVRIEILNELVALQDAENSQQFELPRLLHENLGIIVPSLLLLGWIIFLFRKKRKK